MADECGVGGYSKEGVGGLIDGGVEVEVGQVFVLRVNNFGGH